MWKCQELPFIDGPKDIEIKSKSDLKDKIQKGIEDVEEGKCIL